MNNEDKAGILGSAYGTARHGDVPGPKGERTSCCDAGHLKGPGVPVREGSMNPDTLSIPPLADLNLVRYTANPQTDFERLVNTVLEAGFARGVIGPYTEGQTIPMASVLFLVRILTHVPKQQRDPAIPVEIPNYRFVFNDWRPDRCSLYGPHGPITSGLTMHQARDLRCHFMQEADRMRNSAYSLTRYSCFEHEDGVYERRDGSYVLFKDVLAMFDSPTVTEEKSQ